MGRAQKARRSRPRANGSGHAKPRVSELSQASGLLSLAEEKLSRGDAEEAKRAAAKALKLLESHNSDTASTLVNLTLESSDAADPGSKNNVEDRDGSDEDENSLQGTTLLAALNLLGQIEVELGNIKEARTRFVQAVDVDPDGSLPEAVGGGADKFLWLAQLSEQGGKDSVRWYERGIGALRKDVVSLESAATANGGAKHGSIPLDPQQLRLREQQSKLAGALCSIIEIYMTDLSWETDAEARCEALVAEAMLLAPHSAEPFQTLANIRISQCKINEARQALRNSLAVWQTDDGDEETAAEQESKALSTPDFPARISLARLLMECGMEEDALGVAERLVNEDDLSVEAWYLGGWCLFLLGQGKDQADAVEKQQQALVASRDWLQQSLLLYENLGYEDERLKEHALELVAELDAKLGPAADEPDRDGDDGNEEGWESLGDEEDDTNGADEASADTKMSGL